MQIQDMHYILLDDQATGEQLFFTQPEQVITANNAKDAIAAFAQIESALASGKYIAGYFAYELGMALEPSLMPYLPDRQISDGQTLIHIGVFGAPSTAPPACLLYPDAKKAPPNIRLKPIWSEAEYTQRFNQLKDYIETGHCYQANLTFPMQATTDARAQDIFTAFRRRQPGRYGALVNLGGPQIISFSPELFFERTVHETSGERIRMRPMKGTRPRSEKDSPQDDTAIAHAMRAEPKSQAENLMIVDLLRNDLSRLAIAGSVKVPELFTLETYPTLHQMTSQVTANLQEGLSWLEIFKGLFPCGSVTGAPKIRAMEIIHELEAEARGPYCGSIGFIAPDNSACFNVAIRSAVLDGNNLRYDVGSGVVYDSAGQDEYRECLLKANILRAQDEYIFETFGTLADGSIVRLERHLARLKLACQDKGWTYPRDAIHSALKTFTAQPHNGPQRIRLQVYENGSAKLTYTDHTPHKTGAPPLNIALSRYPLSSDIQTHSVKTSRRDFYDGERARIKAAHAATHAIDEVIFVNSDAHLCEGSFTSLFVQIGGVIYTPPLSSGLLPGILRAEMIENGKAIEHILTVQDIINAEAIFCGNSLRGLIPATLVSQTPL